MRRSSGNLALRSPGGSLPTALLICLSLALTISHHFGLSLAGPITGDMLSLSLTSGSESQAAATTGASQSKLMEQIMNDDISHDFELSVSTLNQLAGSLEEFVRREQMTEQVGKHANLMSLWTGSKGGSSLAGMVTELDYVMASFWAKFKPLVESIVTQRPAGLGPNDLDFRCKRANELRELKEMGAHSSLYSMYLDTFNSELHLHCLLRKLALIKNNRVAPSALVKQFVDIYLDLPTARDPMRAAASRELQEQSAHQILAGHAISFKPETALEKHGSLSAAAQLVFDPRTALSLTPDSSNTDVVLRDFESDCQSHNAALGQIWGEFDACSAILSSQTCNLLDLNEKVKLAAPQLVYGSLCSQLLKLPR